MSFSRSVHDGSRLGLVQASQQPQRQQQEGVHEGSPAEGECRSRHLQGVQRYLADEDDDELGDLLDDVDMSELGEEAEESPSEQVAQSIVSSLESMQRVLESVFKCLFVSLSTVDSTRRCRR